MTDHPVPISETRHVPIGVDENRFRLGHGHNELPFDLPMVVEVRRHLVPQGDPPKPGLAGWTMTADCLTRGTVKIKIAHLGGMEVWVDGERVYKGPAKPISQETKAALDSK